MRVPWIACLALAATLNVHFASAQNTVARGRYLAALGDCAVCHTSQASHSKPYAGGYPLHATFGTVYSSNITPDRTAGIGNWTSEQFFRALHDGISADGHHLYPAFPYPYFSEISRADSDALFAYLRTTAPVRYTPPPASLVFPANIRMSMALWNALFLPQGRTFHDASRSAAWNRGADIMNGIGHCGACHTPKTFFFSDEPGASFRGALIDGWYAPNLTSSMRTGLGRWTQGDIEQYLKTGSNRFGRVLGSMQDVVRDSTSQWTDKDRQAVAAYLKALPAAPEQPATNPSPAAMQNGERIFVERCSVCHAADTKDYPDLAGNTTIAASDPTTILRVIFQGSQSISTPNKTAEYSMPAFPGLSDEDAADVATYIRNTGRNHAGPVSAESAAQARGFAGVTN